MEEFKKLELVGDITPIEATTELYKAAASVIDLPIEKQADLLYFTAIYLSTGENLNHAYFMGNEVYSAKHTIASKALDVEHVETEIIGHLYDYAFMDMDGNKLSNDDMDKLTSEDLSKKDFHVVIAGVIYKSRFPDIAEEVASNQWKVSMEVFYKNFDIKIGDLVIGLDEARSLGLKIEDSSYLGKAAKVFKNGKEIASGKIARVLRNMLFSGCGIVKQPANPPSIILEVANKKDVKNEETSTIVLTYPETKVEKSLASEDVIVSEKSELQYNDTVGICVNYKKEVVNDTFNDQNSKAVHTNWCTAYDKGCTSFSRDTTDPNCLRNKEVLNVTKACVKAYAKRKEASDSRKNLVRKLKTSITKASKLI